MGIHRRHFLKAGLGSAALAMLSPRSVLAFGGPIRSGGSGNKIVLLNMRGGWDSLSLIIPYGSGTYYQRRPLLAVPEPGSANPLSALRASGHLSIGISPYAPELHQLYVDHELAVVHKVGYPSPDLSHFNSQDIMSRGLRDFSHPDVRGWLGRLGDNYFTETIRIVGLRTGNKLDYVGYQYRPVVVDQLDNLVIPADSGAGLDSAFRNEMTKSLLEEEGPPAGLLAEVRTSSASAFELAEQVENAVATYPGGVTYPNTTLAQSLRDVARMIHGQIGTQVFYAETGGFDTHANQANTLNSRLGNVSAALGAFKQDLEGLGAWADTTIVVFSEFGRRNFENGGGGTDHGHGSHFLVLGGGVKGGMKGAPVTDQDLLLDYLPMDIDFRQVYWEVLESRLGLGAAPVFPGYSPAAGSSLDLFV